MPRLSAVVIFGLWDGEDVKTASRA
jgi:hypothetical protein